MGNCLITKLKEVVDNNNLDILGKVRIVNDTDSVQRIRIDLTDVDVNINVVNGYLTDETGTQNYGTTAVNKAGDWSDNTRYVTPGSTVYADKYINQGVIAFDMCYADISSLVYSKFNVFSGRCNGDCSKVKGDAVTLFQFVNNMVANIWSQAYGDLTYLLQNNAATIQQVCPRTKGQLTLNLENINFQAGLNIFGIPTTVKSQDLSKLNGVFCFDRDRDETIIFDSWSGTSSNSYICGLVNVRFATSEEIDRMLIDQSSKQLHPRVEVNQKAISIYGGYGDITRTSASDAAVATLKASGMSISINGVSQ